MGKFLQGLLLGAAAGLLIAPMRGEELRNKVKGRIKQLQEKASNSNLRLTSMKISRGSYSYTSQPSRNRDNEPITLPIDTLERSKSASTSPTSTQPSARQTARTRLYKYESTIEEMDYEPLILPVETFEEPKAASPGNAQPPKQAASSSSATNFKRNLTDQRRRDINAGMGKYPGHKPRQH